MPRAYSVRSVTLSLSSPSLTTGHWFSRLTVIMSGGWLALPSVAMYLALINVHVVIIVYVKSHDNFNVDFVNNLHIIVLKLKSKDI